MKKRLWIVFACLMILLAIALPAAAKVDRTEFEGVMILNDILDPGEEWLSKDGTKIFLRNYVEEYLLEADDDRFNGKMTFTIGGNLKTSDVPDVFFYGRFWGFMLIQNDGGAWVGTFAGNRSEEGFNYGHSVLHGQGGYEGLMAKVDYARTDTTFPYGPIKMMGFIQELE